MCTENIKASWCSPFSVFDVMCPFVLEFNDKIAGISINTTLFKVPFFLRSCIDKHL